MPRLFYLPLVEPGVLLSLKAAKNPFRSHLETEGIFAVLESVRPEPALLMRAAGQRSASRWERYSSTKCEAMAPSATAVTTWRSGFFRTSPTANTPGRFVRVVSSAST